ATLVVALLVVRALLRRAGVRLQVGQRVGVGDPGDLDPAVLLVALDRFVGLLVVAAGYRELVTQGDQPLLELGHFRPAVTQLERVGHVDPPSLICSARGWLRICGDPRHHDTAEPAGNPACITPPERAGYPSWTGNRRGRGDARHRPEHRRPGRCG